MDLVCRDSLSLKEGESYMSERPEPGHTTGKIFAVEEREVGARGAEGDAVALVVGSHAGEIVCPRHSSLEVIDIGRVHLGPGRLVMAPVLVEPR